MSPCEVAPLLVFGLWVDSGAFVDVVALGVVVVFGVALVFVVVVVGGGGGGLDVVVGVVRVLEVVVEGLALVLVTNLVGFTEKVEVTLRDLVVLNNSRLSEVVFAAKGARDTEETDAVLTDAETCTLAGAVSDDEGRPRSAEVVPVVGAVPRAPELNRRTRQTMPIAGG